MACGTGATMGTNCELDQKQSLSPSAEALRFPYFAKARRRGAICAVYGRSELFVYTVNRYHDNSWVHENATP